MNHRAQSLEENQFDALDRNLQVLRDLARRSGLSDISIELITLLALKFICDTDIFEFPNLPPKTSRIFEWRDVASEPVSGYTSRRLLDLARAIESRYERLEGVFSRGLLTDLPGWPGNLLHEIIFQLSTFSLSFLNVGDVPVFGRWFDRCLSSLTGSNSSAGVFVTPRPVAQLMVALADLQPGVAVLDPACGIGSILARCAEELCTPRKRCSIFGQEINVRPWALCKLRLFLLQYKPEDIVLGDSLRRPAFALDGVPRKFDRVICDTPLGIQIPSEELEAFNRDSRFPFVRSSRVSGESAFVQHAISRLAPSGIALVLVSHGFLFRGGTDARLREVLATSKYIKAVIGLPAKLRAETSMETALIIFQRSSSPGIIFIDAATLHKKSRGKAELSQDTIETLREIIDNCEERLGVSRLVLLEELAATEYSLVPKHYITSPKTTRPVIASLREELHAWEGERQQALDEMDQLLQTLKKDH